MARALAELESEGLTGRVSLCTTGRSFCAGWHGLAGRDCDDRASWSGSCRYSLRVRDFGCGISMGAPDFERGQDDVSTPTSWRTAATELEGVGRADSNRIPSIFWLGEEAIEICPGGFGRTPFLFSLMVSFCFYPSFFLFQNTLARSVRKRQPPREKMMNQGEDYAAVFGIVASGPDRRSI